MGPMATMKLGQEAGGRDDVRSHGDREIRITRDGLE